MDDAPSAPTWQCVMIAWGEKYGADTINHMVTAVLARTSEPARFVLITDRNRHGLHPAVQAVPFEDWFLKPEFRKGSCQAKLVMFEKGVLAEDLPAVFVDLDTAILGDLSRLARLPVLRTDIFMFQSVVLPFGWPGRLVYRLTGGRRYARGNSSVVVFHPAECHFIAARFRELYEQSGGIGIRPMISDERFISWVAQMRVRAVPSSLGVKFPNEYMHPNRAVLRVRGLLPWVRARREQLVVVTLPGVTVKPEDLAKYRDGMEIRDEKGRWLIWDRRVIGDIGARLQAYYRPEAAPPTGRDL